MLININSKCFFLHQLLLPSLLTLSFLPHLTCVDVNLVVKERCERVNKVKAFTPALPPRGKDCRTSCVAQRVRVSKGCKDTNARGQSAHRINYANTRETQPWRQIITGTLIIYSHTFLTRCCIFLFDSNNVASFFNSLITTTNRKCKSQGHVRKHNDEIK